jgi:CHRD domain
MERERTLSLPALVVVLIVAMLGLAGNAVAEKISGAKHGGEGFSVQLTGAAERPGPGDPDGTGTARLTFNGGQREVCWDIRVNNIGPVQMAHIHFAPSTAAGPIVVNFVPALGPACTQVDRDLIQRILRNPENYYVNVHNAEFPSGALRGQLG